jgi:salicylate hydroxylase
LTLPRSRSLIVAGAGIGGLSAALALAKANYRVLVLERALSLGESGAGLQLSPNATRALRELGVLDAVRPHAIEPRALVVAKATSGRELLRADLTGAEERYGAPWFVLARSDLHRALSNAAEENVDVVVRTGAEVIDFADHTRGVTVSVHVDNENREELGAAIVGADGLRSKVRTRLHGKMPPRFHRLAVWRALIPTRNLPAAMTEPVVRLWFANEGHIVQYPVANGERINFALVFPEEREGTDGEEKTRDQLPAACSKWAEPLQELLAAAPSFRRFALYDRPPLLGWGKGHATLLGDAAHPMLPFMAQGAAAAIEDAISLGRHLQNAEDIAPALRAYEASRASRTIKLQNASVENGRAYHANGVKRFVRDLLLPRLGGTQLVRRNDWIYRYGA